MEDLPPLYSLLLLEASGESEVEDELGEGHARNQYVEDLPPLYSLLLLTALGERDVEEGWGALKESMCGGSSTKGIHI